MPVDLVELERLLATGNVADVLCASAYLPLLIAEVKRLRLVWSSEKPADDGHWWYRGVEINGPVIVAVFFTTAGYMARASGATANFVSDLCGEWAGPIPMPEEP